jgi:hypothetical protein
MSTLFPGPASLLSPTTEMDLPAALMRNEDDITDPRALRTHIEYQKYMTHWKAFETAINGARSRPMVPLSVFKEIAKGNFVELGALLGTETNENQTDNSVPTTKVVFITRTEQFAEAFELYRQCIHYLYPNRDQELIEYYSLLLTYVGSKNIPFGGVMGFDRAVRKSVACNRSLTLYASFKVHEAKYLQPAPVHAPRATALSNNAKTSKNKQSDICRNWNRGACASEPCEAKRKHVCLNCRGPHKRSDCTTNAPETTTATEDT